MMASQILRRLRALDTQLQRRVYPHLRRVLINARLPMEYAMIAPVYERMRSDPRVQFYFTSSLAPANLNCVYEQAGQGIRLITPRRAALLKFDAYLAADLIWGNLPRGTRRVQMFHGVAGKYANVYDRPERSLRGWDRLFFINRRRLNNFIAAGAIDADSPAARLVGMPKADCLVDGTLQRDQVLRSLGLNPSRPTVLYAPTWTPYSSLNAMGEELVAQLAKTTALLIVKLHDNSLDVSDVRNSGGIDWLGRLTPILRASGGHFAPPGTITPYLVAADVMITDHSSAGFEYLLLDRPLIRIEMPELIARTNIQPEYVELLAEASISVRNVQQTIAAVESGLAEPGRISAQRQRVAEELFYKPGTATGRAVLELYDLLELRPPG